MGEAKKYVIEIYDAFDKAGYYCQHFLLDASKMGVPQRRERVFFICLRKDLASKFLYWQDMFTEVPKITMEFNEKEILFKEFRSKKGIENKTERQKLMFEHFIYGDKDISDINIRINNKNSGFNANIIYDNEIVNTIDSKGEKYRAFDKLHFTKEDFILAGSYPIDYNFLKTRPSYLIGMSVPPVMTAQIASNIYEQWISKL